MYSCHLFFISPASVKAIPFLSFYCVHLCMKYSLGISDYLEEISSLSHRFPLFVCIIHLGRLSYFSPCYSLELCVQMGVSFAFSFAFLFSFSQLFVRLLQATILSFTFLFWGIILITVSYMVLRTFVHSSSGNLFIRSNPLNIFVTFTV